MIQVINNVGEFENVYPTFMPVKKVAVFFHYSNFLLTEFTPKTLNVGLILENKNQDQLHITCANCGYDGSGPRASVRILTLIGLEENLCEKLIYSNDGVQQKRQRFPRLYRRWDELPKA